MAGVWGVVNEMRGEILEIKSQNPSCSSSVTNLPDPSLNLRIESTIKLSEPGSAAVEVMSVTTGDQPMDETANPGPSSSPDNTIELGCSNNDHLLAADSGEEETDEPPGDSHLLSDSEEEKKSPEDPLTISWSDDE
jgi:hypothetical protein